MPMIYSFQRLLELVKHEYQILTIIQARGSCAKSHALIIRIFTLLRKSY